jgi:hypothetical protein
MKMGAKFSKDRVYRYSLCREWDESLPYVLFIGFNPSTADGDKNDETIRRCIEFAEKWGYGGLRMANLFAYVSSNPKDLKKKKVSDPIGIDNDRHIKELSKGAGITVVAWGGLVGKLPSYKDRYKEVLKLIKEPMCLKYIGKVFGQRQPAHPKPQGPKIECRKPEPFHYE